MARVAEAVLASHYARLARTVVAPDDVSKFTGCHRLAPAHVEDPPCGTVILQHEDVGVHNVVYVDVIPDGLAVFVQGRRCTLQVAQAEDPAGT